MTRKRRPEFFLTDDERRRVEQTINDAIRNLTHEE